MIRKICLLLIIFCLFGWLYTFADENKPDLELKGSITISGAWALYPMAVKWGDEFQKLHPKVRIDISAGGAGKGMADALANAVDIGMVSRDINPEEEKKGAWWVAVCKDAVVCTINEKNPYLSDLLKKGITREKLIKIWISGEIKDWGQILDATGKRINIYTRADACGAAETWAKYLGKNQEDLLGVGVYGDPGLAEAVKRDPLGIGFNNVNFAYDPQTKKPLSGIKILPLDLNENGIIDEGENFYSTREQIIKAIAEELYPSPPARELYFVCNGKPQKPLVRNFIQWVLQQGQNFALETGYIPLSQQKLDEQIQKLSE